VSLLATGAASVVLLGRNIGYAGTDVSGFYFVDDNFAVQSYLFFVFSLLMLWAYSRPLTMSAISTWWNRWQGSPSTRRAKGRENEPTPEISGA
jgi:hypothetical protein